MKDIRTIGICAPSSYVEREDIDAAAALMEARGYKVIIHPQAFERHGQLAGTAVQKIDALHALYKNPEIDVIWAAGGGNRALSIIDDLNYDLIAAHPKPMIGFSDVTALLNAITVKTGIANIHGPVFKNLPKHKELDSLLAHDFSMPLDNACILGNGEASGTLYGGNLSVFQYLPETLGLDFLNGAILFLEDCNEEISRIDRMFLHLKRLGVFDRISGLILGQFHALQDSARPFGLTLEDIVAEHLNVRDIPIIMDAPFGHGNDLHPLPIGMNAKIRKDKVEITD